MPFSAAPRLHILVSLLLMGVSLSLAAPLFAQSTKAIPEVRSASADLNGDGKPEKIAMTSQGENPVRFTITVNGVKFVNKAESFTDQAPGFRVVKIDSVGKARQLAVRFIGPNDYGETRFFRWDGKALHLIGAVPNAENITGNGAIYARVWMGFWACKQKYAFNPKTQMLIYVPQPAYYAGTPATVKNTFPIYLEHTSGSSVIANVSPGSKIQLVLFWTSTALPENSTEKNGWYLIKTATGLCGWARLDSFREKVEGLPWAG
jgi:hypothetical protein